MTVPSRPRVLALLLGFWPNNDANGPNQSFRALATALGDEFEFAMFSLGRPPGSLGDIPHGWIETGFARARYFEAGRFGARGLRRALLETPHDLLWLNSVLDRQFTLPALALRRLGLIPRPPLLMSPRGEFADGALGVKPQRKRVYFAVAPRIDLWRGAVLHATSEAEAADIARGDKGRHEILVAPNLRAAVDAVFAPAEDGVLRVTFVGRIVPIKQLDFALRALALVRARVRFEIVGPEEDAAYWRRCQAAIGDLPAHIEVRAVGECDSAGVLATLARTDVFFLPTAGENFGHAIFEALSTGVPALISDRTPWRGLEAARAGWDLPLEAPETFARALDAYAALPEAGRALWREGARHKARGFMRASGAEEKSRAMLRAMLERRPPGRR